MQCEQNGGKHNEPIGLYDDNDEIQTTAAINEDLQHILIYIYTCYKSKPNTHQRKEKRKEFSQNILQQKLHKSVLQTTLNSMCKAKFILIKVRVIALYSDLSYNIQNLISHIIYKINVKKKRNFPHFIIKTMVFSKL